MNISITSRESADVSSTGSAAFLAQVCNLTLSALYLYVYISYTPYLASLTPIYLLHILYTTLENTTIFFRDFSTFYATRSPSYIIPSPQLQNQAIPILPETLDIFPSYLYTLSSPRSFQNLSFIYHSTEAAQPHYKHTDPFRSPARDLPRFFPCLFPSRLFLSLSHGDTLI